MKLFALSDLHLSFDVPNKKMDRFGDIWINHPEKIKKKWMEIVGPKDVVAVTGDISWSKTFTSALVDLFWMDELPGQKVILKGNHDLWWPTNSQLEKDLPPSIKFVQNNHVQIGPYLFFGTRLWDTEEYSIFDLIEWDPKKGPIPGFKKESDLQAQQNLYERELARLKLSIDSIPSQKKGLRIGLTHYPPLDQYLKPSKASNMLQAASAEHVIFGHLHSVRKDAESVFGSDGKTHFHLASCDYLDFTPKFICEAP